MYELCTTSVGWDGLSLAISSSSPYRKIVRCGATESASLRPPNRTETRRKWQIFAADAKGENGDSGAGHSQ